MRLRVSIDGAPAFLDIEGPFTVTPIYVAKSEPESPPDKVIEPIRRKSPKRSRRTCLWCGEGFLGRGPQKFCSPVHKQTAYRTFGNAAGVGRAVSRGLTPLHIHAGASGVEVRVEGVPA